MNIQIQTQSEYDSFDEWTNYQLMDFPSMEEADAWCVNQTERCAHEVQFRAVPESLESDRSKYLNTYSY